MLLAINPPVCLTPGGHRHRGLVTVARTMEAVPQGGGTATRRGVATEAVKNGIFANGEAI